MKRVILESPFAEFISESHWTRTVEENIKYARLCIRDSLSRGEAPIASHLLYTQEWVLDDLIPHERKWWIDAWLVWKEVADKQVFYIDYWMTRWMLYAEQYWKEHDIEIEYRFLYE